MMNSGLRIVLARPDDFESYIGLLEEIAEWLDAQGVGQVRPGTYRQFGEYYASSIAAEEVHLGFFGEHLAGSLRLTNDGGPVWPDADDNSLYLENLVVRRVWRGRSVGRHLLTWAEQRVFLAGKNYIRLDCFANNPVLRKYYQDAEYEGCGEIEAHYEFGSLQLQRFQKRPQQAW